ncbi:hypothetical protein B0H11DRAFT_2297465 [Mycena galericulata]|nr:hypothetical protein B0H11DRAFT_2297465 [Mycena galericulata]
MTSRSVSPQPAQFALSLSVDKNLRQFLGNKLLIKVDRTNYKPSLPPISFNAWNVLDGSSNARKMAETRGDCVANQFAFRFVVSQLPHLPLAIQQAFAKVLTQNSTLHLISYCAGTHDHRKFVKAGANVVETVLGAWALEATAAQVRRWIRKTFGHLLDVLKDAYSSESESSFEPSCSHLKRKFRTWDEPETDEPTSLSY